MNRRTLPACAAIALALGCGPSERNGGRQPVPLVAQRLVDDGTPIGKRWAKSDGVLGEPLGGVAPTPNGSATYQRFEHGVIVHSLDWGAVSVPSGIFDAWLALRGRTDALGRDLFDWVGVPIKDADPLGVRRRGVFERGMILLDEATGAAFTIHGEIYRRYWDAVALLGPPTSDERVAPGGGRFQDFEGGVIHWGRTSGAHSVTGPILERWTALGNDAGLLGSPLTEPRPILDAGGAVVGRVSRFEGGAIFESPSGAFEVSGPLLVAYETNHGGPSGWLGFPVRAPGTSAGGRRYNDFEHGLLVTEAPGAAPSVSALGSLSLYWQRQQGYGGDCVGGICGAIDLYAYATVFTPDAVRAARFPAHGTRNGYDIDQSWALTDAARGDFSITIQVHGFDDDTITGDDDAGWVRATYTIDDLFGTQDAGVHDSVDRGGGSEWFQLWYGVRNEVPYDRTDFLRSLWWSFDNFTTDHLSYGQFAATFRDVGADEPWWQNPFNALFYELVYRGLAGGGNCFGMSLESAYAQTGRTMWSQPIFQYFPETQGGGDPNPANPAHQQVIGEINVKHGYQVGGAQIDWAAGEFFSGATHDPMSVFRSTRSAYARGDYPVVALTTYLGREGHAIRPYAWDTSDPSRWRMYVADPNWPAGFYLTPPGGTFVEIDTRTNEFVLQPDPVNWPAYRYSGGEWAGDRMFHYPFSVLDETPRTPFWEVFTLLASGVVTLVAEDADVLQVLDGDGRSLFEPGLAAPPERWDQLRREESRRIPDLTPVPLIAAALPGPKAELYYGRGSGQTHRYEVAPSPGVAADRPYDWVFDSGTLSAHLRIPGTPGVADRLVAREIGTSRKAIELSIPAGGRGKSVSWTMSGGVKGRWARLDGLQLVPGQTLAVRLENGGYELVFENDGPATAAELTVSAEPGATQVSGGTVHIPGGDSTVAFDVPLTSLELSQAIPGNEGWLRSHPEVQLRAVDYSGTGIEVTEWTVGDGAWIPYAGPFAYVEEGATVLRYRSRDRSGGVEPAKQAPLLIDTRPPDVAVWTDRPVVTRAEPFVVHFTATDPSPGSGLRQVVAQLDGTGVVDGQVVDQLWAPLGTHELVVSAEDVAGWATTRSVPFQLVTTLTSLREEILEFRRRGEIRNDGVTTSLLAKLAEAGDGRDGPAQVNRLEALRHELAALGGKKAITERAASVLDGDVLWVIGTLQER